MTSTVAAWVMPAVACVLMLAVGIALWIAKGWPLVHDAPLMHYVVFLMDHGRAPYRDIVEMNMPGTYLVEWTAMHTLGGGALGWWLWDGLSGLAGIAASAWIAGSGARSAGVAGGALAYLLHLETGALNLGERDWIVAVLLLAAFGCLFESLRKRRPSWMAGFMGFCGLAASIKPPVLGVGVCFLVAACWLVRRRDEGRRAWGSYAAWSVLGGLVPAVMSAVFLWHWGVSREFFGILRGLVPYYASLQRLSYATLIPRTIQLKPLVAGALVVFVLGRSWRRWESDFLGAAALAGAGLFLIQGKGWPYHLYPEIAFASLWAMLELDRALKAARWERMVAAVTLLAVVGVVTPNMLKAERANRYPMETLTHLEADLNSLGGARLSGKVQCLDMTYGGCINVLYRMKLVQATGFIYDFYLFPKQGNTVTAGLQARFLREVTAQPPEVMVLSSHTWPGDVYSYDLLDNWPAFRDLLRDRYAMVRELPTQPGSAGYRIYQLRP